MNRTTLSRRAGLLASGCLLSLVAVQQAHAACYEIYGPKQDLVYRSTRSPVDLSKPLHQTVPRLVSGARMVFSPSSQGCEIEYNRLEPQAMVEIEGDGFRTMSPRVPRRSGKG